MFSYKRCLPWYAFFLACRERGATSGDWRWRLLAARVVVHCPSSARTREAQMAPRGAGPPSSTTCARLRNPPSASCHQHFSPRNAVPSHDPPTHQMSISDQAGTRVIRFLSRRQFSLYEDRWAILLMLHATRQKKKAKPALLNSDTRKHTMPFTRRH